MLKMKFKDGPTVHAGDEWCRDCGSPASGGNHGNHVIAALSKTDLQQPTLLIQPKSNKKSNAVSKIYLLLFKRFMKFILQ